MRQIHSKLLAVAAIVSLAAVGRANDRTSESGLAGYWLGAFMVGKMELRIGLVITAKGDAFTGVLDSLDQGVKDIAMDEVVLTDKTLKFSIKKLAMTYEGTLSEDGQSIKGEFKQSGATLPLGFQRTKSRTTAGRPQEQKKPE